MREIKFRGFDPKSGQMHVPMTLQQIKQVLIKSNAGEALNLGIIFSVTFDDLIFTQFTGLKDKHGKEIYDSDLLKHNDKIFRVLWDEQRAQWACKQVSSRMNWRDGEWINNVRKYIEKVGNIYENPELCQ